MCLQVPLDALRPASGPDESGHLIPTANPIAVATLVVLAGRLPGHAEPGRDFWPPDAQADGVVDEHRELGLCRIPREPEAFDPLQHLGRRQLRNSLRRC
jgi:hypothetical protein